MVESLEQFVALDAPFLLDERRARIDDLKTLLHDPDITLAEKYRRVMEAYQVETDYGRTMEQYRGKLQAQGSDRQVDFLRIGRVALFYQSLDGRRAGIWDVASRSWKPLASEHHGALETAFRMARRQAAPDLLILPAPAPEGSE
jgi:hypothetical protein